MAHLSNREKIIAMGLNVIHEHGYAGSSVRDISRAAGVPLGSFTNHFPSKEAFGLEVLERYYISCREIMNQTLMDKTKSIRERLDAYFDYIIENAFGSDLSSGCLVGNLCAEVANHSDILRLRLAGILEEMRELILEFVKEGIESGELSASLNVEKVCGFICFSLQGAILVSKVLRHAGPINNCRNYIISDILKLS